MTPHNDNAFSPAERAAFKAVFDASESVRQHTKGAEVWRLIIGSAIDQLAGEHGFHGDTLKLELIMLRDSLSETIRDWVD